VKLSRISNENLNRQLHLLSQSNKAQTVIDLFNEFRDEKWQKMRQLIDSEGKDVDFQAVVGYSHMLNHFGFLLEHKYVDVRSLYEMLGTNAMRTWDALSEQIIARRRQSDVPTAYYPYQYHFEYLNYRLRNYFPDGKAHIDKLLDVSKVADGGGPSLDNTSTEI
jgi:hypothetical protein